MGLKFNFNIIAIIFLILIPIIIGIKKLIEYFITKNKRELVRNLLEKEPNKRILYSPSKVLKTMNSLMTPKYFSNIFYKQYIPVTRYNIDETLTIKKYLNLESSEMESNYFFNMVKNNMANNFYMKQKIPPKNYNNFIFPELNKLLNKELKQGYPKNILNIEIISVGDSIQLPTQFFKNDIFICALKGNLLIKHVEPSVTNQLEPMTCYPFCRRRIDEIETKVGNNELREGDFIYIPNGITFELYFKSNMSNQMIFIIEFDNFQKNDKLDNEIELIKLEQIQLRKIPKKIYPKNLYPEELELLWLQKILNSNNYDRNQLINNIL